MTSRTEWGTRSASGHVEEFGDDEAAARHFATFPGCIVTLAVISREVQVGPWSDEEPPCPCGACDSTEEN